MRLSLPCRKDGKSHRIEICLKIRWSEGGILPQELVDILCNQQVPEVQNEDFELVSLCDAVQEEGCEEGCDIEEPTNE